MLAAMMRTHSNKIRYEVSMKNNLNSTTERSRTPKSCVTLLHKVKRHSSHLTSPERSLKLQVNFLLVSEDVKFM
jgi:hypothetical protein